MSRVAVVGLGKIGLPLAVQIAESGSQVIGVDTNPEVVRLVNDGQEPFPGETELANRLSNVTRSRGLEATCDTTDAARQATEIVVIVPLYVDDTGQPDFTSIDSATTLIGRGLQRGALVTFETTLPVGTTRQRFTKILEQESGLTVGDEFHVVFSPERVLTGRVFSDLRRYPKLVGGVTPVCGIRGANFYDRILDFDERTDLAKPNGVWNLGSCEAAELAKLAETTYRDVNIALANQFAKFASSQAIDLATVIEACNSQPYSHIHQPGIAVGGHCIPVYPKMYLLNDPAAEVVRAARRTNESMPEHFVQQLEQIHGTLEDELVLVLGASYRGNVKESAFSGVFSVVRALKAREARCWVTDPYFSSEEIAALGLPNDADSAEVTAIIVQADHHEYRQIDFGRFPKLRTVLNGRSFLISPPPAGVTRIGMFDKRDSRRK
jgi:nucleotide sugar dehydrogenase